MARLLRNATKTYNMKNKIFLLALLFAVTTNAKAQYLKLGINFANITTTNDGDIDNSKILTGFQIGFTGDAKLGAHCISNLASCLILKVLNTIGKCQ
jgi:hypothetical protein